MEPQQLPNSPTSPAAFFDAPDELPLPEAEEAPALSSTSDVDHGEGIGTTPQPPQTPQSPPAGLRRRRSSLRSASSKRSPADSELFGSDSGVFSEVTSPRIERRSKILLASKDHARGGVESPSSVVSSDRVAVGDDGAREGPMAKAESTGREDVEVWTDSAGVSGSPPSSSAGLLFSVAGLVIKVIGLQMSLLFSSVTFPLWLLHCSFLLVIDPFGTLKRGRDHVWQTFMWFCIVLRDRVGPLVSERLSSQRGIGKWVLRVALGCFWSFYVCLALLVCLFSALLIGRLLIGSVAEEPLRFTEELSFDYTKASPVATVPIMSCHAVECGEDCGVNIDVGMWRGRRFIPANHKLQTTVSLTLPESEYNQKLGVFQVKVDVLSANGRIVTSSSRPCMLRYKSPPIQVLKTIFKSGPLLTGYASETQTLSLKMQGFTEGSEPTACIRVALKRRAQYSPGSGLPEIYAAYIRLESELPLFKKIIWNWRRTLFVWISIGLFNSEVLFILICCAPLIMPRPRNSN
ncbi:hypothetical protein Taro_043281 [Colocasia esculenta]|uniref:Seipin n=1 Tax=Colocasia esculenta TaxID=4460 RepID=A0A843WKN7_COLES|nr:hypothetical protein [Colocasia esculenta]